MTCNQTAVAVLQELCMKRKWNPPMYDVTDVSGSPNDPMFEVSVTLCNGVKGVGTGRQKKAAKHDAAKRALAQLQERALPDVNVSPAKPKEREPINPHADVGGSNPVGELQNLCAGKHLPLPEYTVVGDAGEPHEKIFTYKCTVSQRSAIGTARKKQLAKHYAAQNMLTILKSNLKSILDEIPNDPSVYNMYSQKAKDAPPTEVDKKRDLEVLQRYKTLKNSDEIPSAPMISPGTKFTDYHLAYASQLEDYKEIRAKPVIKQENKYLKKLKLIADEMHLQVSITSDRGKDNTCIVFVHVDTDPPTIQAAHDSNEETATELAARNVIEFFDIMSM